MQRSHKTTRAALRLVTLQLFALLACASAATVADARAPRVSGAAKIHAATNDFRTSGPAGAQRRRRRRGGLRRADLTPGVWGGQHARFEVTDGGAKVDLDCAHASADGRIIVDGSGRFSVEGTYYHEHGGPVRENEEARGEPVRLTGSVGGSLMKLTITRGRETVGTYNLTRGDEGRVIKCR